MAGFTRGPWAIKAGPEDIGLNIVDERGLPIAYMAQRAPDFVEANARLIAAAPDLLAALKGRMSPAVGEAEIEAAFQAIDRAEGREPDMFNVTRQLGVDDEAEALERFRPLEGS